MDLRNEGLREIHDILRPPANKTPLAPPASSSTTSSNTPLKASSEFIPHIFYALNQITRDPNNVSNHLESSTGFIRHRLRTCKELIAENSECMELLSRTPEEWEQELAFKEQELRIKGALLETLRERIKSASVEKDVKPKSEEPKEPKDA
ncbi:Cse2p KNAG_0D00580 [Huiozyma naganishii CBS 8797]|uniref:Mediator of RNA polymerase II transcription subunit 9 n=1 Tax=Huiozyma naganishii (strain ATCC MYA-139 / BCRC 22969 / CBS 8797 / KCTC 17520 / NBRC 10181 / NCYC 3082 / Yp74L-3) TaxID=1071383 RepID=J7R4N8_HUIN7|nr:hypothetical protein KNAG_0D00580 [Kazachstania naganishii CBS 8797]CCK69810.1 hypothetical protein KNAG_0D00580 [Kazachstania naganishii CBS 8797]